MLSKLHIQNYAIIDELEILFSPRLNIITGETGAGKSILMGALSLILGERADSSVLQQADKKCVVEGYFNAVKLKSQPLVFSLFEALQLEWEDEMLIRREIAANGKSRAFINDTPVNLAQLKTLSSLLVDLHQQFDTLELGSADFQQQVLDALAGNNALLKEYQSVFHTYQQEKKALESLQQKQTEANATLDYNQFLFDELAELNLQENELEELDGELKLLTNAEEVKRQLASIGFELTEAEAPIVQQLKLLYNKLQPIEPYHPAIKDLGSRLQSAQLELKDIADELEGINDSVQYSAERIQVINDRISAGYKLQKKHGVTDTKGLLDLQQHLEDKLQDILSFGDSISQKEIQCNELLEAGAAKALTISANRKKAIVPFEKQLNALLAQVGMPNARFKVDMQPLEALREQGKDKIEFLFDANKSGRFEPLRKVASGGELSRLMLCIKSMVAKHVDLPTLIFDEIDTGISGEAARQVGQIMKDLAASHQLISITHQPQIAARADAHLFVYKSIKADKIVTAVKQLTDDERVTSIAQMLSGEKPTAAALQNAREMVAN